jgi:hypothetical protein
MPDEQWQARVTGALQAHFIQPDGTSRAGTDLAVELRRGAATFNLMIRAYVGDPASRGTRGNTQNQAQTAVEYVFDRLEAGWMPTDGELPPVTILDPRPSSPAAEQRRGFFARLFGR